MIDENYNAGLCEERHKLLTEWCGKMEQRVDKIETRFLAILVALISNLATGLIILIKILSAK